jgi:hypothetical protein
MAKDRAAVVGGKYFLPINNGSSRLLPVGING